MREEAMSEGINPDFARANPNWWETRAVDPLSDEAMLEHLGGAVPDAGYVAGWQEATRRAREYEHERCYDEARLMQENKRLRERLAEALGHVVYPGEEVEPGAELLEGKESLDQFNWEQTKHLRP